MMDWETWIAANKDNLKHIAGFEEQFVRTVLTRIEDIEPEDVKTQYHFRDAHGGNRYIDFMIINESKGFLLPIELDGLWKALSYHEFNDMLSRQNALLREYGVLLRYTNKTMLNHPNQIINEIKYTLDLQSKNQLTKQIVDKQTAKRIEDYQKELELIKQQQAEQANNSKHDTQEALTKEDLAALQAAISALQDKVDKVGESNASKLENQPSVSLTLPYSSSQTPALISTSNVDTDTRVKSTDGVQETTTKKSGLKLQHMIAIGVTSLIVTAIGANAYFGQVNKDEFLASNQMESSSESVDIYDEESASYDDINVDTNEKKGVVEVEGTLLSIPATSEAEVAPVQVMEEPEQVIEKSEVKAITEPTASYQQPTNINYEEAISDSIPASEARNNIGAYKVVCGNIAQVKSFSKGTYLNFGASYPKQEATIVVWDSDKGNFGDLDQYEGESMCVEGSIDTYKGIPQIKLASANKIK